MQNTILAALDKQDQFAAGTNLKGWLFTIMRNRFYSDLRTQRRRPTSIDSEAAPTLTAADSGKLLAHGTATCMILGGA